ncbi:MAG TPA: type II toxin-antitoxin system HicB family antitoxin [Methylomusa anaerophila]|uniref:HicB family protein n=1 Tax=Methylomusa anaerophila TaxID=1930071 RepID=A0A348AE85_9FIRM|nr:type II toxin-antitoxin system HicB family antitoxin [Methylomusa anaerophila]BBB89383.1 HicB family protein [Methylomusa anaerophila]HML90460.1 type II toxin-antitoxin system HicB family antitoxin [Methylomusa anaerophila]
MKSLNDYLELAYPFSVRPLSEEDGGGWIVEFPDLKGCIGTGDSIEEALKDAMAAKEAWIEATLSFGREVPEPNAAAEFNGKLLLRTTKSIHRWIVEEADAEGTSANQFINYILSMEKGRRNQKRI